MLTSSDVLFGGQFPNPPQPSLQADQGQAGQPQVSYRGVLRGRLLQEESQDPRDQTQGGTHTSGTQRWQERPWVMEENHTQARQVNREESGASPALWSC